MSAEQRPTVVVGMDGSAQSSDALALALKLTDALGARLAPVFVHPYGPLAGTLRESDYEELVAELADSVHARMKELELPPAQRRLEIVSGRSPAAGLQRIAERDDAALIVVGGSRRSRVGRVLPGGTAERLLAGAPCPVAIAPRDYAHGGAGLESVGCGFDGSTEAQAALRWAATLARSIPAKLRLLGVHEPLPPVTVPPAPGVPLTSVNERLREELGKALSEAKEALSEDGLDVTAALVEGSAAGELARGSAGLGLLVLGSRGYGPLGAVLLGSVSNVLVRTGGCPVLVVPRSVET